MANNQILAQDTFASGSLAAGWSPAFGLTAASVVSHLAQPGAATGVGFAQIWTGLTWPNDHASEFTIAALTAEASTQATLLVRYQTGSASGYLAQLVNGTALIFREDSGSFTQLGATVTGLTIAAGDIWVFQAAGAVLNLYQNGNRVAYRADTTYTSGAPGFLQSSITAVAHSKVGSWRGYNAVQQDGIWQKQGIVVPAIASDLTSSGFGAFQASVMQDVNAQILSGTVYKMWFTGGGATTSNIYYAESTDGIAWTRRATAVLAGWSNGQVIKSGSTYYMYAQAAAAQGSGNIALYTSSDGIVWAQQSTTILAKGAGGAWDATGFYVLASPVLFNGIWYMLYVGSAAGSLGLFKMGVATSTDLLNWTKSASNPVLSNASAACTPQFVNGKWYLWVTAGPSSPQWSGAAQNYDPTEGVRYQSADLITWTNPVHSAHHSQLFESVNTSTGQFAPSSIIDVNGRAYMYSISSPGDNRTPQDYQIGLAIAPVNIATLAGVNEDGVSQVATDAFTSGIGGLSANWTTPTGASNIQIVAGNKAEPTSTAVVCAAAYTGASFSADQYSEITIAALTDANSLEYPLVRCQTGAQTWYRVNYQGPAGSLVPSDISIGKVVNGAATNLGPFQAITPVLGDVIRLSVVGNVLSVFQNGTLVQQVVDQTNSPIATGNPGMLVFNSTTITNSQISLWAGGNAGLFLSSSLIGLTQAQAIAALIAEGLVVGTITGSGGLVISSSPAAGTLLAPGSIVNLVLSGSGAYSVPDCRVAPFGPNASRNVNGTLIYDVQTSSNSAIPPTDSRTQGAPVDSRVAANIPTNSRTPGTFGPGVN